MVHIPFKQLQIWAKAMKLTKQVYHITKEFPQHELYSLTNQIRRSSVSIPSNIAEGSKRQTDKDFLQFIAISMGSLAELETQLLLAESFGYLTNSALQPIEGMIRELEKMLNAFSSALKRPR